ncbi:MAG: transporter, partial [Caulobacter sp.]
MPYARHVNPNVIALDSGALMAAFELRGAAFETQSPQTLDRLHEHLCAAWRSIAADDLAIWHHVIRTKAAPLRPGRFDNDYAGELDQAWRRRLEVEGLYENRLILTVLLKGPRLPRVMSLGAPPQSATQARIDRLETIMRDLSRLLEHFGPGRLGLEAVAHGWSSQILSALTPMLEGVRRPVPLPRARLGDSLSSSRLIFGSETIEIRSSACSAFAAMLGLKAYPATTWPGAWDALLGAPMQLVISHSFAFLARPVAEALMGRKQNQMLSASDRAASQVDQLDEAMDDLASGRFAMGEHQTSVLVLADDLASLGRDTAQAQALLMGGGLVAAREDIGLEAAFWSQFPGNLHLRPRPAAISTRNFAGLAPLHAYGCGQATGLHWKEPLTTLRTRGGTAAALSLHVGDLGHGFICGPSGAGKTVLQNFLLSQASRFGARQVLIDKDRGAEVFVRASQGIYLTLRSGDATGLAPLKALGATLGDLAFLRSLVLRMAGASDAEITPVEAALLDEALAAVLRLPASERSFGAWRALLGQQELGGLGARLERWCDGEALGWALDGDEDALDLEPRLVGLDMTSILDDAEARAPVMMYLLHRIGRMANGERLIVSIDEFWRALGDDAFRGLAKDGLKTWRKQNAVL